MVDHPEEYRVSADVALLQDKPGVAYALNACHASSLVTATDVCMRSAVTAMHADRKRMAEALRSRILLNDHSIDGLEPDVQMKVQEMLFDLADQIEAGTLGVPPKE